MSEFKQPRPEALQARNEQDATQGSTEVVETAVKASTGLGEGSGDAKGKPGRKKQAEEEFCRELSYTTTKA